MKPTGVHDVRVPIPYGGFVLRDQWCDAGDDGESLKSAHEFVAAATTYRLALHACSDRAVPVLVRLWNDAPSPADESWEGCRLLALHCPTGELLVETVGDGAIAEFNLPGGAGVYGVRVCWKGREAARLHRGGDAEKFLIDLWWQTPLPPDDDDEDFYGDVWS